MDALAALSGRYKPKKPLQTNYLTKKIPTDNLL
jgi:hypothetical protein